MTVRPKEETGTMMEAETTTVTVGRSAVEEDAKITTETGDDHRDARTTEELKVMGKMRSSDAFVAKD